MEFVFIISSLDILYSVDYMFGDLNIIRFSVLVLMFVISTMFLIISPNVISILLGITSTTVGISSRKPGGRTDN
jgi:NADH-ubiquinone oxidoreductase chain 5